MIAMGMGAECPSKRRNRRRKITVQGRDAVEVWKEPESVPSELLE